MAHDTAAKLEEIREREDLAPGKIISVGLGTAIFLALSLTGLWFFYDWMGQTGPYHGASRFPPPQLQSDPAGDLRHFQQAQAEELQGYAWVDRSRGMVRVPIERAMRIILDRGAAAYDPQPVTGPDAAATEPVP